MNNIDVDILQVNMGKLICYDYVALYYDDVYGKSDNYTSHRREMIKRAMAMYIDDYDFVINEIEKEVNKYVNGEKEAPSWFKGIIEPRLGIINKTKEIYRT